jgi:hypothetical protein
MFDRHEDCIDSKKRINFVKEQCVLACSVTTILSMFSFSVGKRFVHPKMADMALKRLGEMNLPLIKIVTEWGFFTSSTNVNLSSPWKMNNVLHI